MNDANEMNTAEYADDIEQDSLYEFVRKQGIDVARLRYIARMSDVLPVTENKLKDELWDAECSVYRYMCEAYPPFAINPAWTELSDRTDRVRKKYLVTKKLYNINEWWAEYTIGFRWWRLHGKKRKNLKYALKKERATTRAMVDLINKYAGRPDVLRLEARLGSANWTGISWRKYCKEPWFLDGVDTHYGSSYCHIYVKVDPEELDEALARID